MKSDNYKRVGLLTIAAGIAAVLTLIVVLTGFTSGSWLLGGFGDLMDVLNSALVVPLFILLGGVTAAQNPILGRTIQVLGTGGALLRLASALLILSGTAAYEDTVTFVNAGIGLMGIALLLFLLAGGRRAEMGTGYFLFTLAVALAMAVGLLSLFLNDAYEPLMQGEVGLGNMPPFLLALLIFAPLQLLGYPIWLLWTGIRLLKTPESRPAQVSGR